MNAHKIIKLNRLKHNLTQSYMAHELGIDVSNYGRLERGETQISIERLIKISKILKIDLNLLISNYSSEDKYLSVMQEILEEVKTIRKKLK